MGILFRNSEALEAAQRLDRVLFDKTGTLTTGRMQLVALEPTGALDEDALLGLAASAEQGSAHPVALAFTAAARQRGLALEPIEDFEALAGLGVHARVAGRDLRLGKPDWFAARRPLDPQTQQLAERMAAGGRTLIAIEVDGEMVGLAAVSDQVKPRAAEAVASLKKLGIEPIMLTGDNQQSAQSVAAQVGIEQVVSGVLPEQKEQVVLDHQAADRTVAMVGDGINDAPALARADVGIAIGGGTDVAMETADVTLAGGDLAGVARAVQLSRRTMRTIRQNLFWAFFYNLALIPAAAGALFWATSLPVWLRELHPMMAAGAMALSSITVVLNSLRLSNAKIAV